MSDRGHRETAAFASRYGPWAVITGASDGTGAAFARQLAAAGLNLLLIARRLAPLQEFAEQLRADTGVAVRTASIDLFQPGAAAQIIAAATGLEIGLLVSNAGADTNGATFLDAPLDAWRALIQRNVVAITELAYAFAAPMRARGRGGIILMSSAAGLGGQPGAAVYGATKAFDLHFGESLWAELHPAGIDVMVGVCPPMNTPSLQRLLARHGLELPALYDPAAVTAALLEHLPHGPLHLFQWGPDDAAAIEQARRARIAQVTEVAKTFFGPSHAAAPSAPLPLAAADRRAIETVLLRYATSIDTRDWLLFRSCFTTACTADYGTFGQWASADDLTAAMERMHAEMGATLHRITNIAITPDPTHQRRAHARSYVDALLTAGDPAMPSHQGIGLYQDQFVETPQGWQIATRRFIPVHLR